MNVKRMLSAATGLAIGLGLLVIGGPQAQAAPGFQMPFPCGQTWTGGTRGPPAVSSTAADHVTE